MNLEALEKLLQETKADAERAIAGSKTVDALRSAESKLMKGPLADALKNIKQFVAAERGLAGQSINEAKKFVQSLFADAQTKLTSADIASERKKSADFDPTLPPPLKRRGAFHPVTAVQREVERLFRGLGFAVVGVLLAALTFERFQPAKTPTIAVSKAMT